MPFPLCGAVKNICHPCDVCQQVVAIERFHQEGDRAVPQGLAADVIVIMGGDEDHRQLTPLPSNPPLQLRPVHAGEPHVRDDACHARQRAGPEKRSADSKVTAS